MNVASSINPLELDATITALGKIWLQSFLQLHDPNTQEEDIVATAAAASALFRQVIRLSREQTTVIIAQEQLRHINNEDKTSKTVETLVKDLQADIQRQFTDVQTMLQPIATSINAMTEQLSNHDNRIAQLEREMLLMREKLHD